MPLYMILEEIEQMLIWNGQLWSQEPHSYTLEQETIIENMFVHQKSEKSLAGQNYV